MKGRRFLSVLVGFTTCLSMLGGMTACKSTSKPSSSSTDPQNVTKKIDLWTHYGSDDKAKVNYAVSKVKEKYPHIVIQVENAAQDGNQAIKARAASGSLPDIMYLSGGLISVFKKSNSILQLDDYIKKSNFAAELNEASRKNCLTYSDGHQYVFTVAGIEPILWYYNKKLFTDNQVKVPTNYQELLSTVKAFKAKGIVTMELWGKEPWPLGAFFDAFAMRQNPEGVLSLSQNKTTMKNYDSSVKKIKELVQAGMFETGMTNVDYDTAFAAFTSGKAAMFQNGSWLIGDIMKKMGANNEVDYFTSYPTGDGNSTTNADCFANGVDTAGYGVSSGASDKDLCADVARILAIQEATYDYVDNGMTDVSVDTSKLTPKATISAMGKKLIAQVPDMTLKSSLLQNLTNTEFATGFFEEMQKFIVGESVDTFEQNVDKLVQQSN